MSKMNSIDLSLVATDFWGYPVYEVGTTKTYIKDINGGKGTPELYWCTPKDDMDGEPGLPFNSDKHINFIIPEIPVKTRAQKKLIIATMIAANEFVEGKTPWSGWIWPVESMI